MGRGGGCEGRGCRGRGCNGLCWRLVIHVRSCGATQVGHNLGEFAKSFFVQSSEVSELRAHDDGAGEPFIINLPRVGSGGERSLIQSSKYRRSLAARGMWFVSHLVAGGGDDELGQ